MGDWGDILRSHIRIATERDKAEAARIVAERAATAPSDEALAGMLWKSRQARTSKRGRFDQSWTVPFEELHRDVVRDLVDDVSAIRAALQPVPVIDLPEWANHIEIHMGSIPEYTESFGKWHCTLRGTKDHTGSFRMRSSGYRETWQEALAAAIAKAEARS